jgi:hypothetical protein
MPLLGLPTAGGVLSSPAAAVAVMATGTGVVGAGGSTVRAVSIGPSVACGARECGADACDAWGGGVGAGLLSSLPQPRQNL